MQNTFTDFKEFLTLLWVNFKTQWSNFIEFIRVAFRYYPKKPSFCKIDMTLLLTYLLNNPFIISKRFLTEHGEPNVYSYGETPLTTLDHIAKECNLTSD